MRTLILISCLLIGSLGSTANQKNGHTCIDLLQAKSLLDLTVESHFTEQKYTPQNTRRAILNFIKAIDPFQLTVFKNEYAAYSELSPENLLKIHTSTIDHSNADLFVGIAILAKKRLNHLIYKFSSDKAYRELAIAKFMDLKNEPNKPSSSKQRPQNREELEAKFIDLIAADMLAFSKNTHEPESPNSQEQSANRLLVLATRNMRWQLHKTIQELQPNYIPLVVSKAYIESLDPHSELELPSDSMHILSALAGDTVGIGVRFAPDFNGLKIVEVIDGTPAQQSGIQKGDVITHIARGQKSSSTNNSKWLLTRNISIHHTTKYTSGPENSKIEMRILRNNETHEVELTRKSFNLATNHIDIQLHDTPNGVLAHVYVDAFYSGLGEDLRSELENLIKTEKISGIALDLRENGGGSLEEIGKLLGLFINSGPAVYTYTKEGELTTYSIPENTKPLWLGPLVVMTSPLSASAAEATAGAFRDYGRAILVGGDTTFGKGSMQNVIPLNKEMSLVVRVTTALYFTPNGTTPQLVGVHSDIALPQPKKVENYPRESRFENVIPPMTLINLPKIDNSHAQINPELISLINESSISRQKNWQIIKDDSEVFERNTEESLNILSDLVTATRSN